MNAKDIQLMRFYRLATDRGINTIFICYLDDYRYDLGGDELLCERWHYWDLGNNVFGHFNYLDEYIINSLSVVENMIAQRNLRDAMRSGMQSEREFILRLLQCKEEGLEEFSLNITLPEQLSAMKKNVDVIM